VFCSAAVASSLGFHRDWRIEQQALARALARDRIIESYAQSVDTVGQVEGELQQVRIG
jgi:hypothetical protein